MPELTMDEWNALIEDHPSVHLLQTGEWGEFKSAFGWEAVRVVEGGLGAQILFRHLPMGMTFAYIPKGPINWKTKTDEGRNFWKEVGDACRKRRAIFLKVERNGWEGDKDSDLALPEGFVPSPQHVQPRSTLVIDLQGSEEEVFNRMKPKTRYNIRLAGRKDISVHQSQDIDKFHALIGATSRREAFHVHSRAYYQKVYDLFHPGGGCELFISEYQERALAALMVFACKGTAYYLYGASADEERNRKPTYPLQWEAIRWAHAKGCQWYDMWGIPDEATSVDEDEAEGREDGLWGVYRFKRGFGGEVRCAMTAMDRIYNPLLYKLYVWRASSTGSD